MAELIIIRSWTSSQRIAYRSLRLLNKMHADAIAKSGQNKEIALCTYYFKTLMLWACEERREEFWAQHSLVHSMQQLLMEMAEWLSSKHCCNYFIPTSNMMDHLVDTDVSCEVAVLYEVSISLNFIARVTEISAGDESLTTRHVMFSDMPGYAHRSLIF